MFRRFVLPGCLLLTELALAAAVHGQERLPPGWKQLTRSRLWKQDAAVAPDGRRVVFVQRDSPTLLVLMQMDLATGKVSRLHPKSGTSEFEPRFSPDGKHLAYVRSRGNLNLELVIRNLETQQEAVFDPGGGFAGVHSPAFLPGGRGVLFALPEKGGQSIVQVDLNGRNRRDVIAGSGMNNWPDPSPDGKQLVFGSTRHGDFELYLSRLDGSRLRRLTTHRGRDVRPRWSPRGNWIAFSSFRNGDQDVFLLDPQNGTTLNLTRRPGRDDYPAWLPSGRELVIIGQYQGGYELFLVPVPSGPKPAPGQDAGQ